jgi:hypothetical protein
MSLTLSERLQDNLEREGIYLSIYRLDDVIYLVPTLRFFQELEENPKFFDKPVDDLWRDLLEDALCEGWEILYATGMEDYLTLTDDYCYEGVSKYDGEVRVIYYDLVWYTDVHHRNSLVEILKTKGCIELYLFE